MDSKDRAELELRRRQMASSPFCSDHRDKLKGKPCRECEIEHLKKLVKAAKYLILAATGPEGPESWIETRDRWIGYANQLEDSNG